MWLAKCAETSAHACLKNIERIGGGRLACGRAVFFPVEAREHRLTDGHAQTQPIREESREGRQIA